MTSIAVRRGVLLAALSFLAGCLRGGVNPLAGPKTFTFKTSFAPPRRCPDASTADAANCPNKKKDCVYASKRNKDVVKFWPADEANDPKYTIVFSPASNLTVIPDPTVPDDGRHWQLQISDQTPVDQEQKFSVVVHPGCQLDPSVIIGP